MSTVLARAIDSAKIVAITEDGEHALEHVRRQVAQGTQFIESLYPLEQDAHEAASKALALLRDRHRALEIQKLGLKRLDAQFLQWRRPDGYPSLAVFDLQFQYVVLERPSREQLRMMWNYDGQGWNRDRDETRQRYCVFGGHYQDVMNASRGGRVSARFSGILPESARQRIRYYTPLFGRDLYIVAEPISWDSNTSFDPDPLLVGFDGTSFWLLDTFDLTPIEEAAAFLSLAGQRIRK